MSGLLSDETLLRIRKHAEDCEKYSRKPRCQSCVNTLLLLTHIAFLTRPTVTLNGEPMSAAARVVSSDSNQEKKS